ncbi:microtubule-actin cross-linking factor 1, isoforms 6/7-like isoform X9 [Dermatophagoides pteronyssinus]|uniref:microtubule-actin cross-linking factor 1, isoforms 6/7-like isoform X9 n=1 Tax=Dermatophagoides pteronyssinus TaxID=6956 RepID=UPI003F67590B
MGNVATNFGKRSLHENYISAITYLLSHHHCNHHHHNSCLRMWNFLKRIDDDDKSSSINNSTQRFVNKNNDNQKYFHLNKFQTLNYNNNNNNNNNNDNNSSSSSPPEFFGIKLNSVKKSSNVHKNDERDAIQKKTFTKWVNKHLIKVTKGVVDLFEDLRDGNNLISLLEVLSGETLPREKGKLRVHHLQNVRTCLKFLENRKIKLVNIRADDIVDGNPKLTLGLIWTIILHFQLSDLIIYDDTISFKEALLKWARKTTQGYPGVNVTDFTHSWKDGLAFNAILHRNRPDLLDYRSCRSRTAIENLDNAFTIAENDLGVTKLLDPEDVYCSQPDEKSLITYISSLYELFPEPPENNPLLDKERLKRIDEYKTAAKRLVKWIDESCHRLSDRTFSPSLNEMKRIQEELYRFRSEELPPRFKDKQHLCESYKQILEMALALPVRIDDELKPESIERQWKEMLLAYQERDRDIKDYMLRLEDLEHLANKLRKNIRECDRKLTDIEYAIVDLQKRIQHSTDLPIEQTIEQIQKELKFEEKRLNTMINDANYLIDQHYPEAKELYEQVKLLLERYQTLNMEFNERIFGALQDKSIQQIHQVFADYVSALLAKLREQEKKILRKLQEPIPRNIQDIDRLIVEHKEFEIETRQFESDVEKVKREYAKLPTRNAGSQSKFETLIELWQNIWKYSDSYVQQLDAIRIILLDIQDATNMICELERGLSESPDMPADIEHARIIFDDIRRIHSKVIKHQSSFEKLLSNVSKIRNIVERNRPQRPGKHPDIDQLESDVKILNRRWEDIATQSMERIKSLETCTELLNVYRTKMCKEQEWLKQMNHNVDDFVRRKELKNAKQLYEEASSHKISIEDTNHLGVRFMKEAKIYDLKLKNYREKIDEYHHTGIDATTKRSKIISGIDCVEQELKQLNNDYAELLNRILGLLNQLQDDDSKLREFHELADEFLRWLSQKEKIILKLEPICSEPQKLSVQLQQTQQLTEEFVAHSPMLNKIDKFADSLMERLDRTDQQFRSIQEKQQTIHDKWNKLTNILAEREKNLLAVKDAANEFQNKYDRLMAALHKISDDFSNIVNSGADGDEQLLKLSHLEESLESQRPNLADCDRSCQKLCELLTDNGSKNEVRGRVDGLRKFYDDLSQKISDKKAELQSSLKADKDFFFNCNAIQDWLRTMQNKLLKEFKVSAIHEKLLKQVDQFEPLYRECLDKEHEIHILIQKGEELQRQFSRPNDQNQIQMKMDQMKRQYNQLKTEATAQHTKLQKCLDISTKYRDALNAFLPWLSQAENRLEQFVGLVLTKQQMEKMMRDIQALKNDISRHNQDFETICSLGENLIQTADIDTEVIREQLNELKKRWNNLQRNVDNKLQEIENLLQKLNNYDDKSRDLNQGLNRLDDKLKQLNDKDPKQLEKLESLMDDSKKLADDLDQLKKIGNKIIDDAGPDADSKPIRDDLKNFDDRYNTLNNNLADRHRNLQKVSGAMQKFNEDLSALQKDLSALDERLDKMSPIGRKIPVVQMQIEEMKEFNIKLSKVYNNLRQADQTCDDLIAKGFAIDPIGIRNQLDNLHRKYERIKERSDNRLENLQDILNQLKQFNDHMNQNMKNIKDLLKEIDNFRPISRDVETIRQQQKELQMFVQNRLEPLKQQIDEVNRQGNDLIQSASHGVDVSQVENDLEKQNETWNNLKAKVQEREKNLEAAFLQAGRFEDALRNVEKWLTETEEIMAKQKPPSSDYVALKAQIQEQKYLKKTLTDRQESIDNLQELGRALMLNVDRMERNQIEKQLADVNRRFNRLLDLCNERMKILDEILPLAKEFSEKIVPLQEWLESSVRKLTTLQAFSIEPNKLNRRISEHQSFHQDVISRQKDFKNLSNIAQRLIHLIRSDDEGKLIADKLSEVIEKYAKLVEDSDDLQKTLHNASIQIEKFLNDFDKHSKWITDFETRMQKHKILNVQLDKLKDQLNDLEMIDRNIQSYEREINEFIHNGQQLAKQYSTNDSMFIRQKVEMIQNKFNDLRQIINDKLEQIRASMNLAQKFYSNLDELNEWMNMAENRLNQLDSLPIVQQNEIIDNLESEIQPKRRLLDSINNLGTEFARTSPGQGSSIINGLISKCNKRFDSIVDQLQRKSEKLRLIREQNEALNIDIDELFDWFRDAERQLLESEPITSNLDQLLILLRETKSLNDDINQQKLRVREIVNKVKKLMRDSTMVNDELINIDHKTDELKDLANNVSQLCQDRLQQIEHTIPLVEHFFDTHSEIQQFLDEIESEVQMLLQPSIYVEQIRKQQETTKRLIQSLKSNKSLFERLNKTGDELLEMLQKKSDIQQIKQIMSDDNDRYNRLKNLLRQRQQDLENALQQTSLFADKLDGMLNALNNTADQLKNAEPISAHVPKIQEQIGDNNAILDDLKKREDAFNAVKNNAKEIIGKAGRSDEPAIRDIKNKLDRLNDLWNDINRMANERGDCLDDALKLAKQFWNELNDVMRAIKDLEDQLESQEPPAVEPEKIQRQQSLLSEIKHDMDRTRPRLEQCKQVGKNLIKVCGEPDRPEVRKQMEDLDSAWDNVTSLYAKREKNLIDAMEKAMEFHEKMRNLLKFLDDAEQKFQQLGPIAADIDQVKKQIKELKNFKNWVDPHMVDVETLNRMAHELLDRVPSNQAKGIRESINDINKRWKILLKSIGDRQSDLDNALLKLGQFQHSLNELLAWIDKMEKILDESGRIYADPQVIEVELAKHKVLLNDINAHQTNVDSLNQVGRHLIDSEIGSENARNTKTKLNHLNQRWNQLIDKANGRTNELEECLRKSQMLAQEIQDMLAWLNEMDQLISTSKPVGGLPETAREQLNRFMEIYNELDMNRHKVETLLQNGNDYVSKAVEGQAVHLQQNLKNLQNKWENLLNRANDRKIKLEIALKEATEFHEALQEFVDWLTSAEKYLASLQPVSRVLEHVLKQIEEHKQFQKDIGIHRETMLNLDKKGTHLKYFSQKQDVILIKNLLSSVQLRWEKVLTKTAERARNLDHGFKEAKEFHDSWSDLITWLDDAERTLDSIEPMGNNPDLIKQTLYRHKEFQRQLGGKQSMYDSTIRFGKSLKDKAPNEDGPILQDMLDELKNKWNAVCQKSVDKQRKLEEALLFSGQFKDAIQALIEWLEKAKQILAFDQPVHGDLDTVNQLQDDHRNFIDDFKSREKNMQFVRKTAADLMKSANPEDARQIGRQMEILEEKWLEIEKMMQQKQQRLDDALKMANQLHKAVHQLLGWLSDAELKLRFAGPLPDNEDIVQQQIREHENFIREMQQKELEKNSTLNLANEILQLSHPNALPVIKHWITIIQSRWDEVESWGKQREKRLNDQLKSMKDASELLNELDQWLSTTESNLNELEIQPLPEDIIELEKLNDNHQRLIDDLNDKKVDVEFIIKTYSSKKPQSSSTKERISSKQRLYGYSTKQTTKTQFEPEINNPKANHMLDKWHSVWRLVSDRMKRLKDGLNYNREMEKMKHFDFDEWRKRFLFFNDHRKAKLLDFFKRIDRNNDGRVSRSEFIDGILHSRFGTNRLEMETVADIFDINGDRFIDQKEYLDTLRPDKGDGGQSSSSAAAAESKSESEMIQDEVQRLADQCTCIERYKVYRIGEGKYRFGDSQKLRLVRILRSTVMVRVGGGWVSLSDFLLKHDPCRAKGRTNVELREQFVLADSVRGQSMTPFKSKSPFQSDGSITMTGPISKIREKTERSMPMSQTYRYGGSSGLMDDHDDPIRSRSRTRITPTNSRPTSRSGSNHSSSQPPSRTASDMSTGSIEGYKLGSRKKSSGLNGSSPIGRPTTTTSSFNRASSFTKQSSPIGPRWNI